MGWLNEVAGYVQPLTTQSLHCLLLHPHAVGCCMGFSYQVSNDTINSFQDQSSDPVSSYMLVPCS